MTQPIPPTWCDQLNNKAIADGSNPANILPTRPTLRVFSSTLADNPAFLNPTTGEQGSTDLTPATILDNVTVSGLTNWKSDFTSPATAANVYSVIVTAQTTSGAHTTVQVGPNIPQPGKPPASSPFQMPTPPANGTTVVKYRLEIAGTTTAVGAVYEGEWAFSSQGATTNNMGAAPVQTVAIGTNTGSVPAGWSATLQVTTGQVQLVTTTDASDTYTCKAILEWSYTL